jgi:hypothetical protein
MSRPDTSAASSSEDVSLESVSVDEGTVAVTLTISACATAAYLFDAPEMAGQIAAPEALEEARFALLDCIAAGRATVVLAFPRPEEEPPWALVLNPQHEPGSAVAPRVEVVVSP